MKFKRRVFGDVAWSLFEVFETFIIALVAVFVVRAFIAQPFLVSGSSMEPNFYDGDYLLVDELTYRFREPVRGEVVVFRYPGDERSYYIKRVIGLPGEDVRIEKGKVTVTPKGVYECDCTVFALYPGCAHVDTVKTQRKAEGRKF